MSARRTCLVVKEGIETDIGDVFGWRPCLYFKVRSSLNLTTTEGG